ncbi:uncharacterized protein BDZ99DRAFT_568854 [Mytilinidion resinicola]|uniref:DUF7924 domain-containing protein n=1 Tax=Mytilinidion resinicola TaxID=574789 RepID=A0A6A6YVT2_9PEZI|nr:uncharacterized protein BDZ99DRAFT_568854 [Mytilinidion resinicola]KAF2812104.1 hypothetical protein BDZ99DRAFT_568854 [Mytilinidion resinicola]
MARDRERQQSIQKDQGKHFQGVTKQRPLRSNTPLNSRHQQATKDRKRSRSAKNLHCEIPTEAPQKGPWTCPPDIPAPVRGQKRSLPEDSANYPRKRPRKPQPTSYKRADHSSNFSKLDLVEAWLEPGSSPEIYTEGTDAVSNTSSRGKRKPTQIYTEGMDAESNTSSRRRRKPTQTYTEGMDAGSSASLRGSRTPTQTFGKASRSQSQRSLSSDQETSTQASQKTTCTAANYRFTDLKGAGIFVEGVPPSEIQKQIDSVVEGEISQDREKTIAHLAGQLCQDFSNILPGAAGEDDCLELLYKTLSALFPQDKIMHTRKADWRPSLKPRTRSTWDFSFLDKSEDEPGNESENEPENELNDAHNTSNSFSRGVIPRKRAQAEYLSPQHFNESDEAYVTGETPRPDITIGIFHDALVQGLHRDHGLDPNQASYFLEDLQGKIIWREGREEPILCSEPTQRALRTRFPFLIVEGKSYATGKHIFDAENQAATAGACALKIQRDLDDLAKRASKSTLSQKALVFSICTQGPYHELWGHYTVVEGTICKFYMVPIKTCRAPIVKEVKQWLLSVDNVMRWGVGEFFETVIERLGKLASRASGVT